MLALLLLTSCALALATNPNGTEDIDLDKAPELFESFIKKHDKQYEDQKDRELHFDAFKRALKQINAENKQATKQEEYGITYFADYTPEDLDEELITYSVLVRKGKPKKKVEPLKIMPESNSLEH